MINFFSKYKFIFYLCNFILILLYLYPGSLLGCFLYNNCSKQPQITGDYLVSSNHFYSFILISIVGFLTFKKSSQFTLISLYLLSLSIILEFLHYLIPDRLFEFNDLLGNIVGVIIVIVTAYFLKKNEKL